MDYESRRITISHFAAALVCKAMGLPLDCRPQALASVKRANDFCSGTVIAPHA